ncbi:MAG TPA: hypothetical protein VKO38_01380, partial [Wenzhouxiangella sp.]|nr:hypothetical protein [Wenzhouxiangella sp.]
VRNMFLDLKDHGIVEGVLRLASAINRPVVAEGVESLELGFLLALSGCMYAQGYGIARPMPEEAVLEWLDAWDHSDNQWRSLADYLDVPTGPNDLNAALFSLRLWASRVSRTEPNAAGIEGLRDSLRSVAFDEWLSGVGSAHYSHLPQWERLTQLQDLSRAEIDGPGDGLMDDENEQLLDRLHKHIEEIERLLIDMGQGLSAAPQH